MTTELRRQNDADIIEALAYEGAVLRARVRDLESERNVYREVLILALDRLRQLTDLVRLQKRTRNTWTRERETTYAEEIVQADRALADWITQHPVRMSPGVRDALVGIAELRGIH